MALDQTEERAIRPSCTTTAVQQGPAKVGHNGGPRMTALDWFRVIGPRVVQAVKPFQCGARWTAYATDEELRGLGRLQARIERKEKSLTEMRAQRRRVMVRCVRRMRRDRGVN